MDKINSANVGALENELVDRTQLGAETDTPRPRSGIDGAKLRAISRSLPKQEQSSADLIREMRDSDRY